MEQQKKKGGSVKVISIVLVISILLFAAFMALLKFDVFGLGSKILGPRLVNVPIINGFLPEIENEDSEENGDEEDNRYNFETIEEAIETLKVTEKLLKEKEEEAEKISEEIEVLHKEVERLKIIESNQLQFEQDKKDFDTMVAKEVGDKDFTTLVEKIHPETALEIYETIMRDKKYSDEVKKVASIYQTMDAEGAAEIIETTVKTEMDMVVDIMKNLDPEQAGEILDALDSKTADKITRYMYPEK